MEKNNTVNITTDFICSQISGETGIKKYIVRSVVDSLLSNIVKNVARGDKVTFMGFGTFYKVRTKERIGTDVNDGNKKIVIKAKDRGKFNFGSKFEEAIKKADKGE